MSSAFSALERDELAHGTPNGAAVVRGLLEAAGRPGERRRSVKFQPPGVSADGAVGSVDRPRRR